MLKNVN